MLFFKILSNSDRELLNMVFILDPRYIKINFSKIGNIFVNRKDSEELALDYFKIHNAGKTNVSSDCSANDMPTLEKDHFSEKIEEFCENSLAISGEKTSSKKFDESVEEFKSYLKDCGYVSENFPKNTALTEWW